MSNRPATGLVAGLFDAYLLIAGLFDAYPKASSTKMIAGLFDAYSLVETGTYKPSSVFTSARLVTCNRTSSYFVPLEWNLNGYIRNGTFDTTGLTPKILLSFW